jgi:hypothetical protein
MRMNVEDVASADQRTLLRFAAGHGWRQSRPIALGAFVRTPVRRRAGPGVLRPHRPASTAPRRRSRRNSALWRIALVRMHCHQPAKDYVARRTAEGRTKKGSCAASSATSPARSIPAC